MAHRSRLHDNNNAQQLLLQAETKERQLREHSVMFRGLPGLSSAIATLRAAAAEVESQRGGSQSEAAARAGCSVALEVLREMSAACCGLRL